VSCGHPNAAMPRPYTFSIRIGSSCDRQVRNFFDLANALNVQVREVVLQCNGYAPPSKVLVQGLARELDIDEGFLERLADEVRKDF
jgi:hypothetical protein